MASAKGNSWHLPLFALDKLFFKMISLEMLCANVNGFSFFGRRICVVSSVSDGVEAMAGSNNLDISILLILYYLLDFVYGMGADG